MSITIRTPLWFSEIGQKDNQEDYLQPIEANSTDRCFILCDGVGGRQKGEVASKVFASALYEYGSKTLKGNNLKEAMSFAVESAWKELDKYDTPNDKRKMATTFVAVFLGNKKDILIGYIGDSRAYIVSTGKHAGIRFRTKDHSVIEDLVAANLITKEESKIHPMAHVITKAVQPCERTEPTYHQLPVHSGDYIFLCSDGVLEQITDQMLVEILNSNQSDSQKLSQIKNICDGKTHDNYTALLIPIHSVKSVFNWPLSKVI